MSDSRCIKRGTKQVNSGLSLSQKVTPQYDTENLLPVLKNGQSYRVFVVCDVVAEFPCTFCSSR